MSPNEAAVLSAQIAAIEAQARAETAGALALFDASAALRKLVDVPAPPPPAPLPPPPAPQPPPPAPQPPPPAPQPPPPSPPSEFVVEVTPLAESSVVVPQGWMANSASYERWQTMPPVDGDEPFAFAFRHADRTGGRWVESWKSAQYTLLIDGEPRLVVARPAGNVGVFMVDPTTLGHGWHVFRVAGQSGETCYPWPIFVRRNPVAGDPPAMPVVRSSHDSHGDRSRALMAWVPARFDPVTQPLPLRSYDHFANTPMRRDLFMTYAAPLRSGDMYRPRRTRGVAVTANRQGYLINEIHGALPTFPCLDGPRGRGSLTSPTWIGVGREDAQGYANIYALDGGYRLVRMAPDGYITTLLGWRSAGDMAAYNTPPRAEDHELVGDWSRVPSDRRGLREAWQMAWDTRTTVRGSGPPIPNPPRGDEPVHPGSVVGYIADTQHDRILRVTLRGDVHDVPPVIEELIVGLGDPWGVQYHQETNTLVVAERTRHRISRWNPDNGAFVDVLVEGAAGYADLDPLQTRRMKRLQPLSAIRSQPCVMPEGLRLQDGWAYYSGLASQDLRRVNLTTKVWEVRYAISDGAAAPAGAQYLVFDLSDGTVGPRGTAFFQLWSSQMGPVAAAILPDGTPWSFWDNGGNGPGPTWDGFGYGASVGVGNGRIVVGWSNEGLGVIGKARGEPTYDWDRFYKPATDAWLREGMHLLYGPGGFGYYGLPLPWGKSALTDTYLSMYGHTKE